jgi:hypothetical protein
MPEPDFTVFGPSSWTAWGFGPPTPRRDLMKHIASAAVAALLLIGAAGCSSSGSSGHGGSGQARLAAGTRPATSAPPSTTAVGRTGGDPASFCRLITKNNAILQDIAAGDTRSGGVDAAKLLHDLDAAVAAAPAAVKADMQTVVDFDRQLITKHTEIKETPQLNAALRHYAGWIQTHCTR